jgi:hypothetical protein
MISDDGEYALLPSWRHRYWKSSNSSAVLVVFVLLLEGIDHCSDIFFLLCNSFFWLCASVMSLGNYIVAEIECDWYLYDINI